MNAQHSYNEKRLDSLKAASHPKDDEVRRMKELDAIISTEQAELNRLAKCSSKLKDQASGCTNLEVSFQLKAMFICFQSHINFNSQKRCKSYNIQNSSV